MIYVRDQFVITKTTLPSDGIQKQEGQFYHSRTATDIIVVGYGRKHPYYLVKEGVKS